MRVVADTNVLISGTFWKGNESRLLKLCKVGEVTNVISPEIVKEFEYVVSRSKFGLTKGEVNNALELVISLSVLVHPKTKIDVVSEDPDDNRILECAIDGDAGYIVSGDSHLTKLREYLGIKILNASEFLKLL
jgi:putative PIN family toxin of toxin-antitoxin system